MSACLCPENAEAVLGVLEGDPLNEPGENFLGHLTFSLSGLAMVFAVDTGCAAVVSQLEMADPGDRRGAGACMRNGMSAGRARDAKPKTVISSMLQPLPTILPTSVLQRFPTGSNPANPRFQRVCSNIYL